MNSHSASSFISNVNIDEINVIMKMLEKIRLDKTRSRLELAMFCEEYSQFISANYSAKYCGSVRLSLSYLIEYLKGDTPIDSITVKDVDLFILWLQAKAPKGYKVYYRNLKAAFNKAVAWEYLKENPFKKVTLRRSQKEYPAFISKRELDTIIEKTNNNVFKELFFFAFHTGLRLGEIVHLRWKNIDFSNKLIIVGDSLFTTKTKAQRKVPISKELYNQLERRYAVHNKATAARDGYVFCNPNGYHFHPDYVSQKFKKVCRSLNMDEKIHFHSLRHSFASMLVQQGVNLYSVKEILGHSSITTTEVYSHLNIDSLHKAVEVLDAA